MTSRHEMQVVVTDWRPINPPTLTTIGFIDVLIPLLGVKLHRCKVKRFGKDIRLFTPEAAIIVEGRQAVDAEGRPQYAPACTFIDTADFVSFSSAVRTAMRANYPEVFA